MGNMSYCRFKNLKLTESIIEKWQEDKLVQLTFLHKINSIYQNYYNPNIITIETRDDRVIDFIFDSEKSALKGLKLLRDKLLKIKGVKNGKRQTKRKQE